MRITISGLVLIGILLAACSPESIPSVTVTVPAPTLTVPAPLGATAEAAAIASATTVLSGSISTSETATVQPALNSPLPTSVFPLQTIFGIELSPIGPVSTLQGLKEAGVRWIRRTAVPWRSVELVEGERRWGALKRLESELRLSTAQGFKTILVVRETPPWAQAIAGHSCSPIKQEKFQAFALFMRDLVTRYSAKPYNIQYWEIWNEPDIDAQLVQADSLWGCWGNANDEYYGGGYYADMLKVVYPQIKQAQPDSQVLVGGLLLDCDPRNPPAGKDCKPARFLEGILRNGGGDSFDGVAFHAYDYYDKPVIGDYSHAGWHASMSATGPVVNVKAEFVRQVLTQFGKADKFLMNTEMALICGSAGTEPRCVAPAFKQTKAAYIVEAYVASLAQGLRASVWYSLAGWRGSGLLDNRSKPTQAYDAYRFAAHELNLATGIRKLDQAAGVTGYEIVKSSARLWVIWATDGNQHNVALTDMPRAIYDIIGDSMTISQTIQVTSIPIYVEW